MISRFFLIAILIVGAGIIMVNVDLQYLPKYRAKPILITIARPTSSAEEIERSIAIPLEREIGALREVKDFLSISEDGSLRAQVIPADSSNNDHTYLKISDALERIYATFPSDTQKPIITRDRFNAVPILIIAIPHTASLNGVQLNKERVRRYFSRVSGVGKVVVTGFLHYQVVIDFDERRAAHAQLTGEHFSEALRQNNIVESLDRESLLMFDNRFPDLSAIRSVWINDSVKGTKRNIGEFADVEYRVPQGVAVSRHNGAPAGVIFVYKNGLVPITEISRRIRIHAEKIEDVEILYDRGAFVRRRFAYIAIAVIVGYIAVLILIMSVCRTIGAMISLVILGAPVVAIALLTIADIPFDLYGVVGIVAAQTVFLFTIMTKSSPVLSYFANTIPHPASHLPPLSGIPHTYILIPFLLFGGILLPVSCAYSIDQQIFRGFSVGALATSGAHALMLEILLPAFRYKMAFRKEKKFWKGRICKKWEVRQRKWHMMLRGGQGSHGIPPCRFSCGYRIAAIGVLISIIVGIAFLLHWSDDWGAHESHLYFTLEFPDGIVRADIEARVDTLVRYLKGRDDIATRTVTVNDDNATFFITLSPMPSFRSSRLRERLQKDIIDHVADIDGGVVNFPGAISTDRIATILLRGEDHGRLQQMSHTLARSFDRLPHIVQTTVQYRPNLPLYMVEFDVRQLAHADIDAAALHNRIRWGISSPVVTKWTVADEERDIVVTSNIGELPRLMQIPILDANRHMSRLEDLSVLYEQARSASLLRYNRRPAMYIHLLYSDTRAAQSGRSAIVDIIEENQPYPFAMTVQLEEEQSRPTLTIFFLVVAIMVSLFSVCSIVRISCPFSALLSCMLIVFGLHAAHIPLVLPFAAGVCTALFVISIRSSIAPQNMMRDVLVGWGIMLPFVGTDIGAMVWGFALLCGVTFFVEYIGLIVLSLYRARRTSKI